MARKRMLDPKIWDSEQVMSLSPFEFKIYIFLISSADDEGRLKVSYPIFRARIDHDHHNAARDVQKALYHMKDIELIDIYIDDKCEYIQHPNWKVYQKIDKPRPSLLPSKIDAESSNSSRMVGEESARSRGGFDPNRIEWNRIEENRRRSEQEANSRRTVGEKQKRKTKAAPPTATPPEVNSPPEKPKTKPVETPLPINKALQQKTKTKNQQLLEAAELLRVEDPDEYKKLLELHPELVSETIPWEVP